MCSVPLLFIIASFVISTGDVGGSLEHLRCSHYHLLGGSSATGFAVKLLVLGIEDRVFSL